MGKHLHRKKLCKFISGHSKKSRPKIIPKVITEAKNGRKATKTVYSAIFGRFLQGCKTLFPSIPT
jgi:hypothetical protein